jgi:protein TonB
MDAKKIMFILIGLMIVLNGFILFFEWKSYNIIEHYFKIPDFEELFEKENLIDVDTEFEKFIPIDDFEEDDIFSNPSEIKPSFPGGDSALNKFLYSNIDYPIKASENGIQGKVFLTFVIETDGSITDVKTLRGIGGGCDEEAIRVVKMMPKWIPAKLRGKVVRVQFNLPVKFKLQ